MAPRKNPLLYTTLLAQAVQRQNPMAQMWLNLVRTLQSLWGLKGNMRESQTRLTQLEKHRANLTRHIEHPIPPSQGNRLNTLR